MPDSKERLVIEAVVEDEASRALGRINRELGTSDKSLGRAESQWSRLSRTVGKFVGPAVGIGAALTLKRIGAEASRAASAAEEIEGKFKVVFGTSANSVRSDLDGFGDSVGRATSELQSYASSIQDTLVPLGLSRRAAADLSVDVTKLAVDLGSFNNKRDADVIRDIQSALVGQTETVRKYGVVISAASVEQEALRAGLAGTKEEITEADKVLSRLNLILAGTADAQGDATRTAGSFANQMRAISAEFREANELIGRQLNLSLADNAGLLTEKVIPAYTRLGVVVGGFAAQFVGNAAEGLDSLLGTPGNLSPEQRARVDSARGALFADLFAPVQPGKQAGALGTLLDEFFGSLVGVTADELKNGVTNEVLLAGGRNNSISEETKQLLENEKASRRAAAAAQALADAKAAALKQEALLATQAVQREALERLQDGLISGFLIQRQALSGDETGAAQARVQEDFQLFIQGLEDARSKFGAISGEADKAFQTIEEFAEGVRDLELEEIAREAAPAFTSVVEEAAKRRRELEDEAAKAARLQNEFLRNEAGRGLSAAFSDIAFGLRDADDALKGFLSNLGQLLLRRAALQFLTGGEAGGGLFGALGFADGGIPGGGLGTISKFATGGVLSPGPKVAMMNEGPFREAVIPLKPQSDGTLGVGFSGGGMGGNLSITVNALDTASFMSLAAQNPEGLAGVVLQAAGRNPSVRAGFGISGVSQ